MSIFLTIIGDEATTIPSGIIAGPPFWISILRVATDWLFILLLLVMLFEIGNIIWRTWKKKPTKKHLWILLIAFIALILIRLPLLLYPGGGPDF